MIGSRFAVLAGAGISLESGLPVAMTVAKEILSAIGIEKFEQDELLASLSPDHDSNIGYNQFLRFEDIFQALQRYHDPSLSIINELYSGGVPSPLHAALAGHIKLGNPVFTTNFDTLLEKATPGVPVLIDEDDYQQVAGSSGPFIAKLHGTIGGINTSSGLPCATISRILSDFTGNPTKWSLFCSVLAEMPLVVMGYSGSDDFDIMYVLRQVASYQPIIWIKHSRESDIYVANWQEVLTRSSKRVMPGKFEAFLRQGFKEYPCRNLYQCYVIQGDTKAVAQALGMSQGSSAAVSTHIREVPKFHVEGTSGALIRAELFLRLGYGSWVLKQLADTPIEEANPYYLDALDIQARVYFEQLRLNEAEGVLTRGISRASGFPKIEFLLRRAELEAFRLVCNQPLTRLELQPPSPSECRQSLEVILGALQQEVDEAQSGSESIHWAYRRVVALQLVHALWGNRPVNLAELLDHLRLGTKKTILDPFTLAILYLVYWNGTESPKDRLARSTRMNLYDDAEMEKFIQALDDKDALRRDFPKEVFGPDIPADARPPEWYHHTWLPNCAHDAALDYAGGVFEFTDNHPWMLAAKLLLWDDEVSSVYWVHWSYETLVDLAIRLAKSGAWGIVLMLGSLVPFIGGDDEERLKTEAEPSVKRAKFLFDYYKRDIEPITSKFAYWDVHSLDVMPAYLRRQSAPPSEN
jgi:hypothetical protein